MQFEALLESFSQKALPRCEVEFVGAVPLDFIAKYRDEALREIALELDLPGFRKGHVPQDMALKKVGEMAVLEEAVEHFVRDFYPELVRTKKIDAIGRPNIRITKLAPNTPVELTITTAVYPDITPPKNWKELAQSVAEEKTEEPTQKDIDDTLQSLYESRQKAVAPDSASSPHSSASIDDEFARSVGAFKDLADLKEKLQQGLLEERKRAAKEKRRGAILENLVSHTSMDIPQIFVESEIEKMLAQLQDDIARFNIPFEDYLKRIGKTEEELRTSYAEQARKRAQVQLLLNALADQEKIEPSPEEVDQEITHALEHFKNAKPELLRIHIQTVLRNEKVLQMLES